MSDYTQVTDFSAKDALASGDPEKVATGTDVDVELAAIAVAIATKANSASPTLSGPTLTGTVTVPTPADTSDTTVAASTAFVRKMMPAGLIVPYGGSASPDTDVWLLCDGSAVSRATYATLFGIVSTTFGVGDGATTFNVPDLRGRAAIGAGTGTFAETVAEASWTNSGGSLAAAVTSNTFAWTTGMKVQMTTTNTLPTGLSLATDYYVIRASATSLKFATSLANAVAGTAIAWTDDGTGDHTITHALTAQTLGRKIGEETHANTTAELAVHTHVLTDTGHTHTQNANTVLNTGASANPIGNNPGSTGGTTGSSTTGITIANTGSSNAHNNMQPGLVLNYLIKT